MRPWVPVVVGLVAAALGFGGARLLVGGGGDDDVARPTTPASADDPACAPLPRTEEAVRTLELALTTTRARIGTLEQERVAIAGDPIAWPENPPPGAGPDEAPERLAEAAEAVGVTLHEVDCEEDPCVAVASYRLPDDVDDVNATATALRARLAEGDPPLTFGRSMSLTTTDDGMVYTLYGPVRLEGGPRPDDDRRAGFRADALERLVAEEIAAGDRSPTPPPVEPADTDGP